MNIFYKNKAEEEKNSQVYQLIFFWAFQNGKKLCMHVCMYVLACVRVRAVSLVVVVSGHGTMYKYYVFIPALS